MSETYEIIKCANPNTGIPMCRECKRSEKPEDNEYETFNLVKHPINGWHCNGYVSKRESGSLSDE